MARVNNTRITLYVITSILFISYCKRPNAQIIPIIMLTDTDTIQHDGKPVFQKSKAFIVKNYHSSLDIQPLVDSLIQTEPAFDIYGSFTVSFYKESDHTNIENLKENPRDLDRFSNQEDLIYTFIWYNGKFGLRMKYKNGTIIEPKSNIQIRDIENK